MENAHEPTPSLIDLPATNVAVLEHIIDPALRELPARMTSDAARIMLLAIGRQESAFTYRAQVGGPARGLWQFEVAGVTGVMRHPRSASEARYWCELHDVPFAPSSIHHALRNNDMFACGIARLLLWTDPRALPARGDEDAAWSCYLRNWRPGKPSRMRWEHSYPAATETVS
ncbi:MAG TPA: hypothetical protein VFJ01_06135 [Oleiagrimonas sp.]|nr:hypothetical protein [Oleiagrimonas sp.]